jgi:hypothetical protein
LPLDERFARALRSAEPLNGLRSLVETLASEGHDRDSIVRIFEEAREQLRSEGREADEDAVMDVMDFLVGWCSPHMKFSIGQEPERSA